MQERANCKTGLLDRQEGSPPMSLESREPERLQEWRTDGGRLFTCGRPGRATFKRAKRPIGEGIIDLWVEGLPSVDLLHIVSLLGRKVGGLSEFNYYPFRSSEETGTKPTFQEWLDGRYERRFLVHEFPTVDARGIPSDVLRAVRDEVRGLVHRGETVLVVDSAGAERTARVCEACGYQRT
jgi:hypothetical protein